MKSRDRTLTIERGIRSVGRQAIDILGQSIGLPISIQHAKVFIERRFSWTMKMMWLSD